MKNKIKYLAILFTIFVLTVFSSCYVPSPLYGTWQDSWGNKISFMPDETYSSNITINGNGEQQDGTYSVLNNVITFARSTGSIMSAEWDIRGNILYLNWVDTASNGRLLTLMKIAN